MIEVNPVAGRDYPKTWVQFEDWITDFAKSTPTRVISLMGLHLLKVSD
jgi:hypothetical protein